MLSSFELVLLEGSEGKGGDKRGGGTLRQQLFDRYLRELNKEILEKFQTTFSCLCLGWVYTKIKRWECTVRNGA